MSAHCSSCIHFLSFLYFQATLSRASDQTLTTSKSNVAVETGTAVITCTYHFDPSSHNASGERLHQLQWGRADRTLSLAMYNCRGSSCSEHNATPRYSLSITHDAVLNGNLTIASLTLADAGTYTCTVTTTGGIFTSSVRLHVDACPTSVSLSPCLAIRAGDPTAFECATNWTQPFSVTEFRHKGATIAEITQSSSDLFSALTSGGSAMNMTFGRVDHESEVICCAKKIPSCPSSCSVPCTLNIVYPPEVWAYNEIVIANEGTELTLKCQVNSNPEAIIDWYHAGAKASNAAWRHSSLRHVESQGESVINSLHIAYVVPERDYGTFKCVARNSEGSDEHYFHVTGSIVLEAENDEADDDTPNRPLLFASGISGAGFIIIVFIVIICVTTIRRAKAKRRNSTSRKATRDLPAVPVPAGKSDYCVWYQSTATSDESTCGKSIGSQGEYAEVRAQAMDADRDEYMPMTSSHVPAIFPYMTSSVSKGVDSREVLFSDQGYMDSQSVFYETRHPSMLARKLRTIQGIDTTYI